MFLNYPPPPTNRLLHGTKPICTHYSGVQAHGMHGSHLLLGPSGLSLARPGHRSILQSQTIRRLSRCCHPTARPRPGHAGRRTGHLPLVYAPGLATPHPQSCTAVTGQSLPVDPNDCIPPAIDLGDRSQQIRIFLEDCQGLLNKLVNVVKQIVLYELQGQRAPHHLLQQSATRDWCRDETDWRRRQAS